MFIFYRIDGLHFDPPNPQNYVFQSIRGENFIILRILITWSPIPIPILPTTFYRYVGGVIQV